MTPVEYYNLDLNPHSVRKAYMSVLMLSISWFMFLSFRSLCHSSLRVK